MSQLWIGHRYIYSIQCSVFTVYKIITIQLIVSHRLVQRRSETKIWTLSVSGCRLSCLTSPVYRTTGKELYIVHGCLNCPQLTITDLYTKTSCCPKWKRYSLAFPLRNKLSAEDRSLSMDCVLIHSKNIHKESRQFAYINVLQVITTLYVPKTKCVTFEASSLTVAGPELWNSLPHALRSRTDSDEFKSLLKLT